MSSKFYITTPIYYVTDKPHIGHAYTTVMGDIIARWHRARGDEVFFLTGTDEHGTKVERAAKAANLTPKEFVDKVSLQYINMWKLLNISNDKFIRTTDPKHEKTVQDILRKMRENDDIYIGDYEGWYCVPDEAFFTDFQVKDGKCPECGRPVEKVTERSYFFKLSKYQKKLLDFYKANPDFLAPDFRRLEMINRVKEGVKDVSISRTVVKWGVPFPDDDAHTVYVWVDALINYVSALGWPKGSFDEFWPADLHLIGKEINWFHSVIWPAMLMSAGIEPPKKVFAHGWWTIDGQKMSKSLKNAVDPAEMSGKYSVDAFRYFLAREMPLGDDGNFSEKGLADRLNNELASDLGNLVSRVLTLAERYDGKIAGTPELDKHLNIEKIDKLMLELDTFNALTEIWSFVREANRHINEKRPWQLKGEELGSVLYNLLEAVRIISILIGPFMPETGQKISAQLGVKQKMLLSECKFGKTKFTVKKGEHLFKRIE